MIRQMRDFPTCLGENGVQIGNAASCSSVNRVSQNAVICVYTCKLLDHSCLVTITWSKNLMGQCHSVEISDLSGQSLSKAILKPTLFSKRRGFKSLEMNSIKVGLFWDLSSANFGSGPEPLEGFYLALVCYNEMILLIGDMRKEAFRRTSSTPSMANAAFISKREHIFGKRLFGTKVQFHEEGPVHELTIECDTAHDFRLVISLDSKIAMLVKRIQWKFRGNHTIWVDGAAVEVFWDIHNWLFGTAFGDAVFVFQTSGPAEKTWGRRGFSSGTCLAQWPNCFEDSKTTGLGFSLILCVWKYD